MSAGEDRPEAGDAPPAHGRRDRRGGPRSRHEPGSLAARLPVVVVLAAALLGALALDARDAGVAAGAGAGPAVPGGAAAASMPAAPGPEVDSSTWYCAAGTSDEGGTADHTVVVHNPSPREVEARLTVYPGGLAAAPAPAPGAATRHLAVPAGGRVLVRLADVVEAPLTGAVVEVAAGDVAVEHQVAGGHGRDSGPCAPAAAPTWHLAWGSTARDARAIAVLFNPFPSGAVVDASFVTDGRRRRPVRLQGLPVPPRSVVGVDLGDDLPRADHVAGTFRVRTGLLVVERLQVYDGSLGAEGLGLALGAPTAAAGWVFADGEASAAAPATPGPGRAADRGGGGGPVTTERIVVYNPGRERAEVDVVPIPPPGGTPLQPFGLSVGPGRSEVVDYGSQQRIEAGVPYATVVRSTNGRPVVAERVLLDRAPGAGSAAPPGAGDGELVVGPGAPLAAARWYVPTAGAGGPDGSTGGIVVLNPGRGRAVRVRVAVGPPDGRAGGRGSSEAIEVGPGERVALAVDAETTATAGPAVVTASGPVVVERVVRAPDGRRLSVHPAIPLAPGAAGVDPG